MQVIIRSLDDDKPALVLDLPGVTPVQARWLMAVCVLQERGPVTCRKLFKRVRQKGDNPDMIYRLARKGWLTFEKGSAGTIRLARPLCWRECMQVERNGKT